MLVGMQIQSKAKQSKALAEVDVSATLEGVGQLTHRPQIIAKSSSQPIINANQIQSSNHHYKIEYMRLLLLAIFIFSLACF